MNQNFLLLLVWLGRAASQIEIESIFSIASIHTTLRRCRLQTDNEFNKLVLLVKNWPSDPRQDSNIRSSCLEDFQNKEEELLVELEEEFETEFELVDEIEE